jgi:hypothetical protein
MSRGTRSAMISLTAGLLLLIGGTANAEASVRVSAGGGHSCAIQIDQTIVCWGLNNHGQTTPPEGTFTAIDAGGLHTCAIRTDSTVACWGKNDDGESTPASGAFSAISAGGDHSCGLRTNTTLACWGRNTQSPPHNVAPAGSFKRVSAGNTAGATWSCAVESGGKLNCWGANVFARTSFPPGSFLAVGAGGTHACGLRADAALECWGGKSSNGAPMPTPPPGLFSTVSAGFDHSCGIRDDRTLACLGDDVFGQATVPAGTFAALDVGHHHNCAVRSNGAVACWGSNLNSRVSPIPSSLTQAAGEVAPKGIEFTGQAQSTVSGPREVTLTNRGAADLHIVAEKFSGPAAEDFFVGASTCRGPLPGGETCSVWVRFAPQAEGSRAAGLELTTNAVPASYSVTLNGRGGALPQGPVGPQGAAGPQGPAGRPGAGLNGARIACRPTRVRKGKVRAKCTLTLAVASFVRAARATFFRGGHPVGQRAGLARDGKVRIELPPGVSSERIRVVTIDESGRLRAARPSVDRD